MIFNAFLLFIIMLFVVPAVFQWLWNITCPEIFKLPIITYWQAFRLLIISGLLFGGSRFAIQNGASFGQMMHFMF